MFVFFPAVPHSIFEPEDTGGGFQRNVLRRKVYGKLEKIKLVFVFRKIGKIKTSSVSIKKNNKKILIFSRDILKRYTYIFLFVR